MDLVKSVNENDFSSIDLFINQLMNTETQESLNIIQKAYSQMNVTEPNDSERYVLFLLESFYKFFYSQLVIFENADYTQGLKLMQEAHTGFSNLKMKDFEELSEGYQQYYSAIVDVRSLNLNSGLEKMNKAKAQFEKMDKFGQFFNKQINGYEAESLILTGFTFIAQLDYENGQIAFEKAANTIKKVAIKYCEKDSDEYNLYLGLSYLYNSILRFWIKLAHLNNYSFDYFEINEDDVNENAVEAIRFFSSSVESGEMTRIYFNQAKGYNLLSNVVNNIGLCMNDILILNKKEIQFSVIENKKSVRNASKFFTSIGDTAITLVRLCKEIDNQISNIQRFIKSKNIAIIQNEKSQNLGETIQKHIENGKIEKALDCLLANSVDFDLTDEAILLKSRYSYLLRSHIEGSISENDFAIEKNKLSKSVLEAIKLMD
jgi:Effector-associated domain 11